MDFTVTLTGSARLGKNNGFHLSNCLVQGVPAVSMTGDIESFI